MCGIYTEYCKSGYIRSVSIFAIFQNKDHANIK